MLKEDNAVGDFVDVTRGDYGLEIPCMYCLYGPKVYIDETSGPSSWRRTFVD